jgi:monovalent cation:H+ antiporter-2, CPA2 family
VLEHAGLFHARALVVVISEQEAVPRIIHKARRMAPSIYIIARTQHIRNAQYLLDLGADEVVSEEYEAAKEIFTRALRKYQLPESEIGKIVKKLQKWGYSKFTRNGDNGHAVPGMDTVLLSLRIHMLTVEPGSFADKKTIAELDLKARFGIKEYGLRRNNVTEITTATTTRLQEGDALILFTSDKTVQEIAGLFSHPQD